MSKSLKRVENALAAAGVDVDIVHMTQDTKTAAMAAAAVNCNIDQIAKSVIFLGSTSRQAILFLTAGGNMVDPDAALFATGEPLEKADAAVIREQTGFAIGGVSPLGHLAPIKAFMDPTLLRFEHIWAAAGTPHHMFQISPDLLMRLIRARVVGPPVMGRA